MKNIILYKRFFTLFVLIGVCVLFSSCSTSPPNNIEYFARRVIHWDENLPDEQVIALNLQQGLHVIEYNGITVDWPERTVVYLPAGTVNFLVNVRIEYSAGYVIGSGLPYQWTFNPGDRFFLMPDFYDRTISTPGIRMIDMYLKIDYRQHEGFYTFQRAEQ